MKKSIFLLFFILIISLTACTPKLNQQTAITKLEAAGCFYHLKDKSECIKLEDPYYIIQKQGCLGNCRININTQEIKIDNPMCTGALNPGECTTDADCAKRYSGSCALRYTCQDTSCIPVFE